MIWLPDQEFHCNGIYYILVFWSVPGKSRLKQLLLFIILSIYLRYFYLALLCGNSLVMVRGDGVVISRKAMARVFTYCSKTGTVIPPILIGLTRYVTRIF